MPSPNPPHDDHLSPDPATPRKPSSSNTKNNNNATTTPIKKSPSPAATPKSAPAAAGARPRPKPQKGEPTLLTDFFLGRQSAARVAAERKRRQSMEAVKAELREDMKQSAVRRLQPPGGVKDRVQSWQRSNAAVVVGGADDLATEPTEVAFRDDEIDSVTEEDRVRIKMRMKKRSGPPKVRPAAVIHPSETNASTLSGSTEDGSQSTIPPKKRVVSDDHWVKPKIRKHPVRRVSPRTKKSTSPTRIPAGFVLKSGPSASVPSKVKAWADKVEIPDEQRTSRSTKSRSLYGATTSDVQSDMGETSSQVTARQTVKLRSKSAANDGIRVTAARKNRLDDDGIRVSPVPSTVTDPDDAIRIRPVSGKAVPTTTSRPPIARAGRQRSKTASGAERDRSRSARGDATEASSVLSRKSGRSEGRDSDRSRGTEDQDSLLDTPTKRQGSTLRLGGKTRPKTVHTGTAKLSDDTSALSDDYSNLSSAYKLGGSDLSSIANKSLADIPGDIPFGHSAFSELDLPLNGVAKSRPKRPKVDRNTSLKGMPNVLRKVVEEGKKIIQDMNEPPRQPFVNKPPSIEKWLNNTVDPFVDSPAEKEASKDSTTNESPTTELSASPKPKTAEKEATEEAKTRRKSSFGAKSSPRSASKVDTIEDEENTAPPTEDPDKTPDANATNEGKTSSGGLKRSRATRSNSSPLKPTARRQLLGVLKEAFTGESSAHSKPIKSYKSHEERKVYEEYDPNLPSEISSSYISDETSALTADQSDHAEATTPKMAGPRYRPPTKGHHELSTIMSEEDSSAIDSDLTSDVTDSTLTQSTALTKDSETSRPQRKGSGLKRRLTRHSDLVSVLSLPDDSSVPKRIQSNRSRPSLRKARGTAQDPTADELLREFADDENLYLRELKTLVDGVVPVLLSQVVHGGNATELFGSASKGERADSLSKSVVNMGVALEKLNNAHKKAPVTDLRKLAHWAHGVVPAYHNYLKAWRLGFQDVVVNLAPRAEKPDDDDSLLNALPRNEKGDVVNENGERVAVAYLLKKPLMRVKQMARFIKCVDSMMPSDDTRELLRDFEELQDKARRRHKEETARMTDEDAINTDTTRARDPRTLKAMEAVVVDPGLQVNAKDIFSLNLAHSNGQRLECQVELVHRDNQSRPDDAGDLLIRETGDAGRAYLLFPPILMAAMSARTGEGNFDMVVMLRGTYCGKPWHELITLSADSEDQILDWLDILPLSPVPPKEPEPSVVGDSYGDSASPRRMQDGPVGARNLQTEPPPSPIAKDLSTKSPKSVSRRPVPARYGNREPPATPAASRSEREGRDTTPTQDDYRSRSREERSQPSNAEELQPEPLRIKKQSPKSSQYRDDGAPPPPAHRTLSPSPGSQPESKSTSLTPPVELKKSERIRRRTSSPLKHEYLPSDMSSASETYSTEEDESASGSGSGSDSGSESSDDEIDSLDIPETELGFSIKKGIPAIAEVPELEEVAQAREGVEAPALLAVPPIIESIVSGSDCSLTPSNSASQAGLHGHKTAPEENAARYMASISRWSDKGMWKDVFSVPCSIILTAGLIEAFPIRSSTTPRRDSSGGQKDDKPLLALDLTPLVLIRQSTALDLEIRSSVQPHCRLYETHSGGNFRFRCHSAPECFSLYMSVHHARLNNQKFIQLENEARFKSFGERTAQAENDGQSSGRRRTWFGRKNSYRGSVRAPAQSQDGGSSTPSSNPSASSFLKRLTVGGNISFNIARSSIDKQGTGFGGNSLYTTSGSSSASGTPPRSPSISVENSGRNNPTSMSAENMRIRLHLLVTSSKWEDYGNCSLQIRRPPPGWHQALRADHGLEKRITVTTMPKRQGEQPRIVLDAVLGSGCFSSMGSRGIVCGVWEEVKDGNGVVGSVPATGATGGMIKKWCFQCGSAGEAAWVLRAVHQEVLRI